jgi:hypothetical protein
MRLYSYSPFSGLDRFFSFLIPYTVIRTPWTGDQPITSPLLAHMTTGTQNKRPKISMARVGFESMVSVFEQAKRVHASDRCPTVVGAKALYHTDLWQTLDYIIQKIQA